LLFGLRHKRVFIDVEYAPNTVVPEILILTALSVAFRLLLHIHSPFHNILGDTTRNNFQLDYSALHTTNVIEVNRFSHLPFAHDQEPGERLAEAPTTP
jgi:hypothetical protein